MKLEAVAASKSVSRRSSSSTVAFSWEHKPGVSKQSHSESKANKPAAGARRAEAVSRRTPASSKKQAPAQPAAATAHRHRLRVPPPPGGPGAPGTSSPGRTKHRSSRRVRPADDPFLAAYLACTEDGRRRDNRSGKRLGWTGLGLGLGLGTRGLGLSCKSSCEAMEECVVKLTEIPKP